MKSKPTYEEQEASSATLMKKNNRQRQTIRAEYYVYSRDNTTVLASGALDTVDNIYFFKIRPDSYGHIVFDGDEAEFSMALQELSIGVPGIQGGATTLFLGLGNLDPISSLVGTPPYPEDPDSNTNYNPNWAIAFENFIGELRALLKRYPVFQGLDIDWETGVSTCLYGDMIRRLKSIFQDYQISISIGANNWNSYFDKAEDLRSVVDYINIQGYGPNENSQSPAQVSEKLNELVNNRNIPKEKIIWGLPVYAVNSPRTELCRLDFSWKVLNNAEQHPDFDPYANLYQHTSSCLYHYNGLQYVFEKASIIVNGEYGGIFTWEPSLDLPYTNEKSIMRMIDSVVKPRTR